MEKTVVQVSRFWRIFYVVFPAIVYGTFVVDLLRLDSGAFEIVICLVAFIGIVMQIGPLFNRTRLVVEQQGLTLYDPYVNKTLHFDWHEIAGASVKNKMVVLELHDTRAYEKKLSWLTRFNLVARSILNGAPFVIGTMELSTKTDEIQALILEGIEQYGNRRNESKWQDDD